MQTTSHASFFPVTVTVGRVGVVHVSDFPVTLTVPAQATSHASFLPVTVTVGSVGVVIVSFVHVGRPPVTFVFDVQTKSVHFSNLPVTLTVSRAPVPAVAPVSVVAAEPMLPRPRVKLADKSLHCSLLPVTLTVFSPICVGVPLGKPPRFVVDAQPTAHSSSVLPMVTGRPPEGVQLPPALLKLLLTPLTKSLAPELTKLLAMAPTAPHKAFWPLRVEETAPLAPAVTTLLAAQLKSRVFVSSLPIPTPISAPTIFRPVLSKAFSSGTPLATL